MPLHPMESASIDIIDEYWDELLKDQGTYSIIICNEYYNGYYGQ